MKKLYKEPLFHFLLIGASVFLLFSVVDKGETTDAGNEIVVSTADIDRLSSGWSKRWNRQPTEIELQGLVDSHIKEEVYYREALALGLDNNDTIVRRRLMQKMKFLSNDLAELSNPDEDTLKKYLQKHLDKYEVPARVSFTHIYFSYDKRDAGTADDAKSVLSELKNSATALRAPERGDNFMMEYDFTSETPFEVSRLFGNDFSEQLFTAETDGWVGPIESGYGLHLVRISEKIDSRMPELASVIDKVRTDWMFEQKQKMNEEIYKRFKEKYKVVVEKMSKQNGMARVIASGKGAS